MYILGWRLIGINAMTFAIRGWDKRQAVRKQRRISEKYLLFLSALGGRGGARLAMHGFRHKTIKSSFLWKFWTIVMLWLIVLSLVLYRRYG